MSKLVRIVYNGDEAEVLAYASDVKDLPALLCEAGNAANALLPAEGPGPCCETAPARCCSAAPAAGYEANGQILAKLAAVLQTAIANAPQLIAEISALIALFGGKVAPPAPSTTN